MLQLAFGEPRYFALEGFEILELGGLGEGGEFLPRAVGLFQELALAVADQDYEEGDAEGWGQLVD